MPSTLFGHTQMIFETFEHPRSYDHFIFRYARFKYRYRIQYNPNDITIKGKVRYMPDPLKYWNSIEVTLQYLENWLKEDASRHIREQTTADLWDIMHNYSDIASDNNISENDKTPFSTDEKQRVRYSLNDFGRRVTEEYKPTAQQIDFITERLQYLSIALDRLNRFDWKGLAISIVVSIGVNLGVDTETGRQLYELFLIAMQAVPYILPS